MLLRSIICGLFINSMFSLGQASEPFVEDYSIYWTHPETEFAETVPAWNDKKKYKHLFEHFLPRKSRAESPQRAEAEKSFFVHFKDTRDDFPLPADLNWSNYPVGRGYSYTQTGKQTYVGIFRRAYRYDVDVEDDGTVRFTVKVHFEGASDEDVSSLKKKFLRAEDYWNRRLYVRDFPYYFSFKVVEVARAAHFSVRLKDNTRGPYDVQWSRSWPSIVMAHEFGHMVGLGDEYKTLTGEIDCLESSIMCTSWDGQFYDFHYYHVIRRLFLQP